MLRTRINAVRGPEEARDYDEQERGVCKHTDPGKKHLLH